MSIFYMDPIGGNDANDASSFAQRVKTFLTGLPAFRTAPGDEIRYIASPDPTLVGNATWTDNSRTVTLASACTLTVENCEVSWTASANVTASTSSAQYKQGTVSASLVVASGFTTGLVAYRTLAGTLDLSAYEQISLQFRSTLANVAGSLELRLCSDTVGAVAVHTIPLMEAAGIANAWAMVVKDFGAALSSSVASIAIYAITDPGSATLYIDNVIACKATSAADSLTHVSLIGKMTVGEPEWYPIMSIDGTTVMLGSAPLDLPTVARPYNGTTETVATYKRQPLDLYNGGGTSPPGLSANRTVTENGSAPSPTYISGGWDRTNMSTQSGETWISGAGKAGSGITTKSFVNVSNIGGAHFSACPIDSSAATDLQLVQLGASGCLNGCSLALPSGISDFTLGNVVQCSVGVQHASEGSPVTIRARRVTGSSGTAGVYRAPDGGIETHHYIDRVDNGVVGFAGTATDRGKTFFYNTVFDSNTSADISRSNCSELVLSKCYLSSTTPFSSTLNQTSDTIAIQGYNGSATDHQYHAIGVDLTTSAVQTHGTSTYSWFADCASGRLWPTYAPFRFPLFRYAAAASVAVTFHIWVYRANTTMQTGLFVRGGKVAGIASDQTAFAVGSALVWEQVSLTVTPTEDGIIEVFATTSMPVASDFAYFDDASVT